MDELEALRDLAASQPVGDETQVRADARRQLMEAMASGVPGRRARREWIPRLAIGGGVAAVAGLMAASFLHSNKLASGMPGDGLYEAVGVIYQGRGWPAPRICPEAEFSSDDCEGPEILGWNWNQVRFNKLVDGKGNLRWREAINYRIVGRFVGKRFELSQQPQHLDPHSALTSGASSQNPGALCEPHPALGEALSRRTVTVVNNLVNSFPRRDAQLVLESYDGPSHVLNLRLSGDMPKYIQAVRAIYKGPLCVIEGELPSPDLLENAIESSMEERPDPFLHSAPAALTSFFWTATGDGAIFGRVFDDGSFQRWMDEKFGPGRVRVQSLFRPYNPDIVRIDRFWKTFGWANAQIDWKTTYHTLSELRAASALVVRGTIERVDTRPAVSGPALYSARLRLRVGTTISGSAPPGDAVTVDVMLPGANTRADAAQTIAELRRNMSAQEIVAFLGAPERGVYRPMNDIGLWAHTSRARVDAPLAPLPPQESAGFLADMYGVETLDQMVAAINYVGKFRTIPVP